VRVEAGGGVVDAYGADAVQPLARLLLAREAGSAVCAEQHPVLELVDLAPLKSAVGPVDNVAF